MFGYSLFFFSEDHSFIHFSDMNLHKIAVITLGIMINYVCVSILKRNRDRAGQQLAGANEELLHTNAQLEQTNEELKKVNELLKSMATRDSLTNLRNRHALRQDFEMYIGIPLHVMFIDLDNFKEFNDTKGHAYGDQILAVVGKALTESFRTYNCYRYGGDEFLIIGEHEKEEAFLECCNNARNSLESADISFSGGYVTGVPETIQELRMMIMQADKELYKAKNHGKNQFGGAQFDHEHVPDVEEVMHYQQHREERM